MVPLLSFLERQLSAVGMSPAPTHPYLLYIPVPISILQGEGKGHRNRKKMVTIPAGSILAFRVAQLLIGPKWGEW